MIPTISWAGLSTINICTSAIEKGCVIAISTVGCQLSKFDFLTGYDSVLKTIEPSCVICVGKPFKEMQGKIVSVRYSRTTKVISSESILENTDLHIDDDIYLPFEEFEVRR